MNRREFLVLGLAVPIMGEGAAAPAPPRPWWRVAPTFCQSASFEAFSKSGARVVICNIAADPTWGPVGMAQSRRETAAIYPRFRQSGARVLTYLEGFGDCMVYAVALERRPDGSYPRFDDEPGLARFARTAWCWGDPKLPQGNQFAWVGVHNFTCDEPFARGAWKGALPVPRYPDGRPATGAWNSTISPLSAAVYDACASKDINGRMAVAYEAFAPAHDRSLSADRLARLRQGLIVAVAGRDEVTPPLGVNAGDPVWCSMVSVHKDLAAPFWREYGAWSCGQQAAMGLDGVWCDNFSPWDNFGYPPLGRAFGDWSMALFDRYRAGRMTAAQRSAIGESGRGGFDARLALKERARAFGAADPSDLRSPAWSDRRWIDDPLWCAYRSYRAEQGAADLRDFRNRIKAATTSRPQGFLLAGNDIPMYGLGWLDGPVLDMVNTEVSSGWHMGTGSRGIGIPPEGRMAAIYRAAREHQSGPFVGAWYYLDGTVERHRRNDVLARTLLAEAWANGALLMHDTGQDRVAGSAQVHHEWNRFIAGNQSAFADRTPVADTAVIFSPACQLRELAPGGFPDMDRQPHLFGHWGWATALMDLHRPYRALAEWNLAVGPLAGLRTVIAPSLECLEPPAAAALEQWVRSGGRLVVAGPFGTRRGVAGRFDRRDPGILGRTDGALGKGVVARLREDPGAEYYATSAARPGMRAAMARAIGPSAPAEGAGLPATVGLSLWQQGQECLMVDLWNTDLRDDHVRLAPADAVRFRLRLPGGRRVAKVETLAPDPVAPATVAGTHGQVTITLPELRHYACVRVTMR